MSGKPPSVVFREFRALRTSRPPRQCRVTGHVGPELGEPPSLSSIPPVLASSLDSFASAFTPLDDAIVAAAGPVPAVNEGTAPFLLRLDSLMGSKRSASTLEESSQFCSQFTSAVPETVRARGSSLDEEEEVPTELPEEGKDGQQTERHEYSSDDDEERSSYAATVVQETLVDDQDETAESSLLWEKDVVAPSPRAARLSLEPVLPSARSTIAPWARSSLDVIQNVRADAGPQQPILSPRDARPMLAKRRPTEAISRGASPLTSRIKWNPDGMTARRSSFHHATPTYPDTTMNVAESTSSASSYDTFDTALRLVGHSTTRVIDLSSNRQASLPPSATAAYRMIQQSGGGSPIGRPESLIKEIPQSKMRAGTIAAVPPAILNAATEQQQSALSSRISPRIHLDDEISYAAYLAGGTARRSTRGKRRRDIGMLTPGHNNGSYRCTTTTTTTMVNPEPSRNNELTVRQAEANLANRMQQQIVAQQRRSRTEKKNVPAAQSPAVLRSCCIGVPNSRKRNRLSGRGGATFATAAVTLNHHLSEDNNNKPSPETTRHLIQKQISSKETPSATPPPLSSMRPWDQPAAVQQQPNTAKPTSITLLTPPNVPCTPTAWTGRYKNNLNSATTVRPTPPVILEPRSSHRRVSTTRPTALTERAAAEQQQQQQPLSTPSSSKPRNVFSRTLQMMRHIASPRN